MSVAAQMLQLEEVYASLEAKLSDGRIIALQAVVPLRDTLNLPEGWQGAEVRFEPSGINRYGQQRGWLRRVSDGQLLQNSLLHNESAMAYWHSNEALLEDFAAHKTTAISAQYRAEDAKAAIGTWAEVTGRIHSVHVQKSAAYLNFAEDWKTDFTIYVPKSTLRQFDESELIALESQHVTVRGWVHRYYGPRVTLLNPDMLKVTEK